MRAFTGYPYPWGAGDVYQGVAHRIKIQERDGSWSVDLSKHVIDGRTIDWINSWSIDQSVDNGMTTASLELMRDWHAISLVPTKSTTSIANWNTSSGATDDLLDVGKRITIETQFPGHGYARNDAGTWDLVFDGWIDTVDWADDDTTIKLTCRDFGALLEDRFIEVVRIYGAGNGTSGGVAIETVLQQIIDDNLSPNPNKAANQQQIGDVVGVIGGTSGAQAWTASTAQIVGDTIRPTARNGLYYKCTIAGTTATAGHEPTWPTTIGNTVVDSGATWQCAGYLPTLSFGVAAGWNISPAAAVDRQPVLDALRAVAQQIGGDVRMLFDSGAPALWFTVPGRSLVVVSTFGMTGHVRGIKATRDINESRNRVQVIYYQNAAQSQPGQRTITLAEDSGSETSYGVRFCELAEPATPLIGASTQANALRDAVLYDLKYPRTTYTVECDYTPNPDLFDKIQLPSNATLFDTTGPTCGVIGITHAFERGGKARTTLKLRDSDAPGSQARWLQREVRPGVAPAMGPLSDQRATSTRAWLANAQSISTGTLTVVKPDTLDHDTGNSYASSTGVWMAWTPGSFSVEVFVTLSSATVGCQAWISIYRTPVGGAATEVKRGRFTATVAGDLPMHVVAAAVQIQQGDTIDMRVQHNDSTSLNAGTGQATTWLQIKRVR